MGADAGAKRNMVVWGGGLAWNEGRMGEVWGDGRHTDWAREAGAEARESECRLDEAMVGIDSGDDGRTSTTVSCEGGNGGSAGGASESCSARPGWGVGGCEGSAKMSGERLSPDDEVVATESRLDSCVSSAAGGSLAGTETAVACESRLRCAMFRATDIPSCAVARGGMFVIWKREGGGSLPNICRCRRMHGGRTQPQTGG